MFWGLSLISSKSTPGSLLAIFLSQFLDKFSHVFWGMQSLRDCLIASMPLKRAVKQIHLQNSSLQTLYSVRKDIKLNILICHDRQMKNLKDAASAFVFHLLRFLFAHHSRVKWKFNGKLNFIFSHGCALVFAVPVSDISLKSMTFSAIEN